MIFDADADIDYTLKSFINIFWVKRPTTNGKTTTSTVTKNVEYEYEYPKEKGKIEWERSIEEIIVW